MGRWGDRFLKPHGSKLTNQLAPWLGAASMPTSQASDECRLDVMPRMSGLPSRLTSHVFRDGRKRLVAGPLNAKQVFRRGLALFRYINAQ